MFVPILSEAALKHRFKALLEDSVYVDNVLLEHRMAIEYRRRNLLSAIFPVAVGTLMNGQYNDYYDNGCGPDCSQITVQSIESKFCQHLERQGLGVPYVANMTVGEIYKHITDNQGAKIKGSEQEYDAMINSIVDRICVIVEKKKISEHSPSLAVSCGVMEESEQIIFLQNKLKEKDDMLKEKDDKLREKDEEIGRLRALFSPLPSSEIRTDSKADL